MNQHVTNAATTTAETLSPTNHIEKTIELKAPLSRVWQALTDHKEFGAWFGVAIEAPFMPGQIARGKLTHPCYEHARFEVTVVAIEPERLFSYRWHPNSIDPDVDLSQEEPTLVVFTLEPTPSGTRLRVVESGFDKIPAARRAVAFSGNNAGWTKQIENIKQYIDDAVAAVLQRAAEFASLDRKRT